MKSQSNETVCAENLSNEVKGVGRNQMKTYKTMVMFLVVAGLMAGNAQGAAVLITNPGTGNLRDDTTLALGFKFTPATNIVVMQLGYFDDDVDGNAVAHDVKLWTDTGTLLRSVTVQAGMASSLVGQFRYETLSTPIVLTNGVTYRLASDVFVSSGDQWHNASPDFSLGFPVTFNDAVYGGAGTFPSVNTGLTFQGYIGPNFIGEIVPESSTVMLLGLGGLVLAWRRHSQNMA